MRRTVLDGKGLSKSILQELSSEILSIQQKTQNFSFPKLAYIYMGNNQSVLSYLSIKHRACESLGIQAQGFYFPENTDKNIIKQTISLLNAEKTINGILVQLPLCGGIDEQEIIDSVIVSKDVDGLHSMNISKLAIRGQIPEYFPCTPMGCIEILGRNGISIQGKHAVVLGRSTLAGMSLALMLQKHNATVTICHSMTENLFFHTQQADILVVAIGKPGFITSEMVKPGVIIIDIGITKVDGQLKGDVQDEVKEKSSFFTPVPGGVGPMTVAMLMKNLVKAWQRSLN